MKKILLFMGAVALSYTSIAQTQVTQGDIIIDPYIGTPNWANSLLYNQVNLEDTENVTDYKLNGGLLSYGGRVEYMISDDFGIGVDVNYEVSGFNYNNAVSEYDSLTNTLTNATYNYDYKAKKLRAMLRLNYHFIQTDRIDVYSSFAGGYKYVNRIGESNDPNYENDELDGALIPVAFRLAAGARVYFTNNIGAHIELGAFGGALLQFGISAKFPTR
ncbi:MAG: hypothetical protein P8H33_01905 [Crocinitomicaceae bacterium]|nr:hypothetical protein [Crocinitomicaceae bacterium]